MAELLHICDRSISIEGSTVPSATCDFASNSITAFLLHRHLNISWLYLSIAIFHPFLLSHLFFSNDLFPLRHISKSCEPGECFFVNLDLWETLKRTTDIMGSSSAIFCRFFVDLERELQSVKGNWCPHYLKLYNHNQNVRKTKKGDVNSKSRGRLNSNCLWSLAVELRRTT